MKPRLLIALFSFISAICIAALNLYFDISYYHFIFLVVSVFTICFLLFFYATEKFIYQKIQVVYKLISNLKIDRELKDAIGTHVSDNPIADVEQEVMQWAQDKKKEIDDLQKLEKFRRDFLANISHELKTPIFGAQGYIQTAIDGDWQDLESIKLYLNKADKNIDRLCMLVQDLDDITNLETGEIKMNFSHFNINNLIADIIDDFQLKSKTYNVEILLDKQGLQSQYIFADEQKIRQVLINLIDNSLKYGNQNGETKVSMHDMAENVLIEVTDNGIGIKEAHLSRLFERFYRTDESRNRKIGGTGLGLAIVKHIIEAHSQTINVRSTFGIGTTFAFTLKKGKK